MTGRALADFVVEALRSNTHDIESIDGTRVAPAELIAIADRVAQALADRGVTPAEPVHVRIGNRSGDIGALLGIWQAGAVAVPLHVAAAPATIASLQTSTGARLLVDGDRLETIGPTAPAERQLLRDAALVMFTSGSTGQPKGVVVGHQRLADKLAVLDRLLKLRSDDVVLVPLQLTFIFGLWVSLLALHAGARLVLIPKFSPLDVARGVADGATVLGGVPSMYRALMAGGHSIYGALLAGAASPRGLRMILTGGEVLPAALATALRSAEPDAALYDLYGLTETGSCDFVLPPHDQPDGFGTIGAPTESVAFRLAAPDGREAADGETGELQIRTPYGMLGYLDAPELTADSFSDGYFRTGDLARKTGGRVQLVGRSKDIVSRGGIKIAPLEIDNLLCEHPDVAAALCAGVPDERLGEVIHAVVVAKAGADIDADALRAWMLERTERFKVPDVFHFRDALPAGATGKADRRAVARLKPG
jgi:long-chain acyl-CoA synthetase